MYNAKNISSYTLDIKYTTTSGELGSMSLEPGEEIRGLNEAGARNLKALPDSHRLRFQNDFSLMGWLSDIKKKKEKPVSHNWKEDGF